MENNEKANEIYIKLKYNDKEIVVNGTHIHKKADENGPEVEGEIAKKYLYIEFYEDGTELKNIEEARQNALKNNYTDQNFYEVRWNGQVYTVPLSAPKNVDKDVEEEMYYWAKDKYFDLECACDNLRAQKEIPELIRNMKAGEEFNFAELLKKYIIVTDYNEECFEVYSKIVGDVVGLIKVKICCPERFEKDPYNLDYVRV